MSDKTRTHRIKNKAELNEELAALHREVAQLKALAAAHREAQDKAERLATFPEENPNPVIELNFDGETTYVNPVAQERFPDLWQLQCAHPLMQGLQFPFVVGSDGSPSHIVREIQVADSVYEQKICYMGEAHRNHIRIYVHDVTRRKRAEETNQKLLKRLVHAHEEERQRLSRELHDEAGQALTALKLSLELIQTEIPAEARAARRNLTDAIHLTEATKEQIRMLAQGLRPPALDALGLNLTLESFCRDFSKRTKLRIQYRGTDVSELPDVANMCVYRTLQEALANVVRHAGATRVDVRLLHDVDCVRLIVEDNGTGLGIGGKPSASKESGGIGLLGMQERLDLFGGGLRIDHGATGGLRLSAYLPLRERT